MNSPPCGVRAYTWAVLGLAGSDRAISFLAGVSGTESQGTFSKGISDCGDGGLEEQLKEDGVEISIGVSRFWTSFWGESGLPGGKRCKSPGRCGRSPDVHITFPGEGSTSVSGMPPGDGDASLGDGGMPPGDGGTSPGDGGMSVSDFSASPGDVGAPPGDAGTPPGDAGRSLSDGSTSPGDCGTSLGDCGMS